MFLCYLKDNVKDAVIDLMIHIADARDGVSQEEKDAIDLYYAEMGMENRGYEVRLSKDEVIKQIDQLTTHLEKRMILFETIAISFADGKFDQEEKDLVAELVNAFGVESADVEEMQNQIVKLRNVYQDIRTVIVKE